MDVIICFDSSCKSNNIKNNASLVKFLACAPSLQVRHAYIQYHYDYKI